MHYMHICICHDNNPGTLFIFKNNPVPFVKTEILHEYLIQIRSCLTPRSLSTAHQNRIGRTFIKLDINGNA